MGGPPAQLADQRGFLPGEEPGPGTGATRTGTWSMPACSLAVAQRLVQPGAHVPPAVSVHREDGGAWPSVASRRKLQAVQHQVRGQPQQGGVFFAGGLRIRRRWRSPQAARCRRARRVEDGPQLAVYRERGTAATESARPASRSASSAPGTASVAQRAVPASGVRCQAGSRPWLPWRGRRASSGAGQQPGPPPGGGRRVAWPPWSSAERPFPGLSIARAAAVISRPTRSARGSCRAAAASRHPVAPATAAAQPRASPSSGPWRRSPPAKTQCTQATGQLR